MIITVMTMMIKDDDKDDDNCRISVRIKLDYGLLIPSSIFPSRFQMPCIRRKLLQTIFDLVKKSD